MTGWQDGESYLEQVVDGVFAFIQPDGSWMINNTGAVLDGRGRPLLVDTSSTHRRTQDFLDKVGARTGEAPVALVNTHHHPDHTYGNSLVPEAAVVIGHDRCREEVIAAGFEATRVVTQPDYGPLELRPPALTFTGTLTWHLPDREVQLHSVGPAHTTNDVVVWLPQDKVVFTGDVTFAGGQPFLLEGSLAGFPKALAHLRSLGAEALVPGHGPVVRGPEVGALLDRLEDYVAFVDRIAREGHAEGLTPLQTAQRHQDNPFSDWQEAERLVGNLHRAYSELDGNPLDHRLSVGAVWPEMEAFVGHPIGCHA
ncbi:MBL fold metallo-hydrolase [Actinomycetota bacterium]